MAEAVLLVGTKKGLWIGRSDESRRSWTWSDPEFLMQGIYATGVDTRWDHPHRPEWGAGYGGQAIHTIVPHPDDGQRLTVAMSTGGVYQTADGGGSWNPTNQGISASFFPDPWPEFGQGVHKVPAQPTPARPGRRPRAGCRTASTRR